MSSIEVKTFDNPDESNTNFKNAKIDIVKVGDQRVMRLVLQPGWKWSQDIKPTVGTDSCKAKHLGVIVSGAVCAKHDDGTELTYKAGYAVIPEELKLAAAHLVEYYTEEGYVPRKSLAGSSVDNVIIPDKTAKLPPHIRIVLDHYRKVVI